MIPELLTFSRDARHYDFFLCNFPNTINDIAKYLCGLNLTYGQLVYNLCSKALQQNKYHVQVSRIRRANNLESQHVDRGWARRQ